MAKPVKALVKLQIQGGKANPAPPVGSALGQHGVQIQSFCQQFNDATKDRAGETVPVIITIYDDRSFSFVTKTPPAAELIKKAINLEKGSAMPNKTKVGSITVEQLRPVAERKMPDLNCYDVDTAVRVVAGTAKSMGLKVEGLERVAKKK